MIILYLGIIDRYILEKTGNTIFLGGSNWNSGGDQIDRFIEEGIWENGYDDRYLKDVNTIKENGVLIFKSTFPHQNGENYLRVKAIDTVLKNHNDGRKLDVNWYRLGEYIDIENFGYYTHTIDTISPHDISVIFNKINEKIDLNKIINDLLHIYDKEEKIPILDSDVITGDDYLSISGDVNALARIITSNRFIPPLAIALFGEWGSGKSFFMEKLKNKITSLSNSPIENYENGICHIHFNAWSYLDANLWASIATRIFEGLYDYIDNNYPSKDEKDKIKEKLNKKITLLENKNEFFEREKMNAKKEKDRLEKERNKLKKEKNEKENEIEKTTLKALIGKGIKELKIPEEINKILKNNNFDTYISDDLKEDPSLILDELKKNGTFFKDFLSFKNLKWSWITLSITLLLIVFIVPSLDLFSSITSLIPQSILSNIAIAIPLIKQYSSTYNKFKPVINGLQKINKEYQNKIEECKLTYQELLQTNHLEVINLTKKIDTYNSNIYKISNEIIDIENKLSNSLATITLHNFIKDKNKDIVYKKHLGLVSLIRKDFETLSNIFRDSKEESNLKGFNPLNRIVLYIDDLDRCKENRVVEVLEAVNLLMAFPLFVVVVGVDPKWVKIALEEKYKSQFIKEEKTTEEKTNNYLEKIFQIPLHLKIANDGEIKKMLHKLNLEQEDVDEKKEQMNPKPSEEKNDVKTFEINGTEEERINTTSKTTNIEELNNVEHLKISKNEIKALQDFSSLIGSNPRIIKRFTNIYKIIKAHDTINLDKSEKNYISVMFLIALSIGKYKNDIYFKLTKMLSNSELIDKKSIKESIKESINECSKGGKLIAEFSKTPSYEKIENIELNQLKKYYKLTDRFKF